MFNIFKMLSACVCVCLFLFYQVNKGDRIAQLILERIYIPELEELSVSIIRCGELVIIGSLNLFAEL